MAAPSSSSPASPRRRPESWPRDWITWAACIAGIVVVGAYVTAMLISRFEFLAFCAGFAVGVSLAPVLGARRTRHATIAMPVVLVISTLHPYWMLAITFETISIARAMGLSASSGGGRGLAIMLAVTAGGYSVLLGIASRSWKTALAILACGAASILVEWLGVLTSFYPSISFLCVGVVIIPAIDTLARAGRLFNPRACRHCSYDLSGLGESVVVCPECGGSVRAAADGGL